MSTTIIWFYSLISVFFVGIVSLIGLITLPFEKEKLKNILIYFVSFSAGALFGDVFIHLIPEIAEKGLSLISSLIIVFGIFISFFIEKIICWRHCHLPITKNHIHRFAYMNIFGDSIHNFIDGLIIAASYLASIPVGIATTVAVILHEIPQEIGDFGVLLHGGFSRKKALFYNFLTALTAVLGALTSLVLFYYVKNIQDFLIPFAAGGFIYIAGSDLIPELHKEIKIKNGLIQLAAFALGIILMLSLLLLE